MKYLTVDDRILHRGSLGTWVVIHDVGAVREGRGVLSLPTGCTLSRIDEDVQVDGLLTVGDVYKRRTKEMA